MKSTFFDQRTLEKRYFDAIGLNEMTQKAKICSDINQTSHTPK
jgi:hypothetical protein